MAEKEVLVDVVSERKAAWRQPSSLTTDLSNHQNPLSLLPKASLRCLSLSIVGWGLIVPYVQGKNVDTDIKMLQVGITTLRNSQSQWVRWCYEEICAATSSTGSFCVNRTSVDGRLGGDTVCRDGWSLSCVRFSMISHGLTNSLQWLHIFVVYY